MRSVLKSILENSLTRLGYQLRCVRYIAPSLLDAKQVVPLNFEHAVTALMHRLQRQQLTFIQVGAFDGVSCDPIRNFVVRYGWKGVLLEPQPSAFQKLVANYAGQAGLILKNCAVAQSQGSLKLYTVDGEGLPAWCGGLAGFSRESIEKHEPFAPGISNKIVSIDVPTVPFADLLNELGTAELDLLQTDTEGFDAQLLDMFPLDKVRPKIIHFERKHLSVQELERCLQRLAEFGYQFATDGEEDMLAILKSDSA